LRGCAPRAEPTALHTLLDETLSLYEGLFAGVRFERRYDPQVHLVRLDAEQLKRVIINPIDNAVEAMERKGTIWLETELDHRTISSGSSCRTTVPACRQGSVTSCSCRTLDETPRQRMGWPSCGGSSPSCGSIEVAENMPQGSRFTIELPA
jgi:hypothetical protein